MRHFILMVFSFFILSDLKAVEHTQIHQTTFGKEGSPEEIIEYTSMTCHHCANFHLYVLPLIQQKYIQTGQLRLVIRPLATDKDSLMAFKLLYSLPLDQQEMAMTKMFSAQRHWIGNPPEVLGRMLGLTPEQSKTAMANKEIEDGILSSAYHAQKKYNIDSTPTFYIRGVKIEGAPTFEDFQASLDRLEKSNKDPHGSTPTTRLN